MTRTYQKAFLHYSLSFYQKEKELGEISNRARLGFSHFDKNQKGLKEKTKDSFIKFCDKAKTQQKILLNQDPDIYIDVFLDIILNLSRDRDLMQYVLPTFDAILTQERSFLRQLIDDIRKGKYPNLIAKLKGFSLFNDYKAVTILAASRIVSTILGQLPKQQYFEEQKKLVLDLLNMRKSQRNVVSDYGLLTCFVHLNKHSQLAQIFLQNGGDSLIQQTLNQHNNDIQAIYYTLLNVWTISFIQSAVDKFISVPKIGIIRNICIILQKVSRQKITRVAFMIFKNIQNNHACLQMMMDNKLLKIIDTILKGNIKDEELINSLKDTGAILQSNIRILSSFDKYVKQINSQNLQWSSVHNQRFWKENAIKFQANDYQLIKKLKYLLNSKRSLNVAIACYDLGQFCRFYPRGKAVIESNQIKDIIMQRARFSQDKAVRQQALLALQKIMIQNWQAI